MIRFRMGLYPLGASPEKFLDPCGYQVENGPFCRNSWFSENLIFIANYAIIFIESERKRYNFSQNYVNSLKNVNNLKFDFVRKTCYNIYVK